MIRRQDLPAPAGIEPTFNEFAQYLIHTDLASYGDDHWMPYYLFCTPCVLDYDIVAKVSSWTSLVYFLIILNYFLTISPKIFLNYSQLFLNYSS